jgi:hypothetical protein
MRATRTCLRATARTTVAHKRKERKKERKKETKKGKSEVTSIEAAYPGAFIHEIDCA